MKRTTKKEMNKFDNALVVTHIVFRKTPPFEPLEGPYSSVAGSLETLVGKVYSCQIPISGFNKPVYYGRWKKERKLIIPSALGIFEPLKYLIDFLIVMPIVIIYCLRRANQKNLVVGIDPLSCVPLIFFKKILKYKLIFYSVDFNRTRFKNKFLQYLYEKADELSSKYSDQTWVVCESLKNYKKSRYQIDSVYIPNSPIFNPKLFEEGKKHKTGNKLAWTGSFLTDHQYDLLFNLLQQIQNIRPDMEFYFAPMSNYEKFRTLAQKYNLHKSEVLEFHSRGEWQEFASKCDVGIAIYDPNFGSTEFIEPLKIWDFMVCGMPFIISCEPSISNPIKESGVAYFLDPENKIGRPETLKEFLKNENMEKLRLSCLKVAEEYDIRKQIEKSLARNF